MKFVPKFHNDLITELIILSAPLIIILIAFISYHSISFVENYLEEKDSGLVNTNSTLYENSDIDDTLKKKNDICPYELPLTFGAVFLYIFISWITLNLVEKNYVYEEESETYYRDIINNISPAELSYIDDYSAENRKDILSTVLMLHLKGNIKIENNRIKFISRFKLKEGDYYNLTRIETMVLDCLEKNKSPFSAPISFEKLLLEDLVEKDLIENTITIPPHAIAQSTVRFTYGLLLFISGFIFHSNGAHPMIISLGAILCVMAYAFLSSPAISLKGYRKLNEKGNEIRLKLTGLKKFLRDYSDMKNKEMEEIELWDQYIIYSIILNDNKKAQKKLYKLISEQYKK